MIVTPTSKNYIYYLLTIITLYSCKTSKEQHFFLKKENSEVSVFKVNYKIKLGGGKVKNVNEVIYAGFTTDSVVLNGRKYNKLIFGNNQETAVGLVRRANEGLYCLPLDATTDDIEKPFLKFNVAKGDSWIINLGEDLLWQRKIVFTDKNDRNGLFVYELGTADTYTTTTTSVNKLYYSKNDGFTRLQIKTHWAVISVDKEKEYTQQ